MKTYRIKPFPIAMGIAREKSRFTYLNYYGEKVDIPYFMWFIEGADRNIIVDTGISASDYRKYFKGQSEEQGFVAGGETFKDVEDVKSFEDSLAELNLKPEDIDIVIHTHLHWDHCMNTWKCKNAKVIVQEEEWKSVFDPHPIMQFSYATREAYEKIRNLELIRGDKEILPGLSVILSPGHTQGGQSVSISTEKGRFIISGYCAINHNFYPPKELQKRIGYPVIAPAVHINSIQAYETTLKLVKLADQVLPSHEVSFLNVKSLG